MLSGLTSFPAFSSVSLEAITVPVDLKKLDEKIRKLQMIRELASDPETATLLNDVLSPNGNGAKNGHAPSPQNGESANPEGLLGYADRAVRAISGTFTTNDLITKMKELGYVFTAKDAAVATYGVMLRLRDKGVISIVEKGGPGRLAKWSTN